MTPPVSAPARTDRAALVEHLVASRICGPVATTREHNLGNARRCSERDPGYLFGLTPRGRWSYEDVVALMAERVGISPDLALETGQDHIDPELCVDRLEAMGRRLAEAADARSDVLLATGHPAGLLAVHTEIAHALAARGCRVLAPAPGWPMPDGRPRHLRHVGGVAMLCHGADLVHTHDPAPMEAMLAALSAAGEPLPGLVVADHGFAGAAGAAGVPAVGFADCNDPALFVGEAEDDVEVAVPLDDNVLPHLYAPLTAYLLEMLPPVRR